jgi:hypothetical protein
MQTRARTLSAALSLIVAFPLVIAAHAEVELPSIFSEHMAELKDSYQ